MQKLNRNGFSLVELIVVIAIMAVLVGVLAPALLTYVERSRAQKDDSAMCEVTNAIQLAMADQAIYDEILAMNVADNFAYYNVSTTTSRTLAATGGDTASVAADKYKDTQAEDEVAWKADGHMRGVTITFTPSSQVITMKDGAINNTGSVAAALTGTVATGTIDADCANLKNKLNSVIGETLQLTSQSYRNSPYTVFIQMGTLSAGGGISVYGQWGGQNL